MQAYVNRECTGCGLCESTCPDVFRMKEDGLAEAYAEITADTAGCAKGAAELCPASAIDMEEA